MLSRKFFYVNSRLSPKFSRRNTGLSPKLDFWLLQASLEDVEYILFVERYPCLVKPLELSHVLGHFAKAAIVYAHFLQGHWNTYLTIELMDGMDGSLATLRAEHVLAKLLYSLHRLV